jgi:hypothetical protein
VATTQVQQDACGQERIRKYEWHRNMQHQDRTPGETVSKLENIKAGATMAGSLELCKADSTEDADAAADSRFFSISLCMYHQTFALNFISNVRVSFLTE